MMRRRRRFGCGSYLLRCLRPPAITRHLARCSRGDLASRRGTAQPRRAQARRPSRPRAVVTVCPTTRSAAATPIVPLSVHRGVRFAQPIAGIAEFPCAVFRSSTRRSRAAALIVGWRHRVFAPALAWRARRRGIVARSLLHRRVARPPPRLHALSTCRVVARVRARLRPRGAPRRSWRSDHSSMPPSGDARGARPPGLSQTATGFVLPLASPCSSTRAIWFIVVTFFVGPLPHRHRAGGGHMWCLCCTSSRWRRAERRALSSRRWWRPTAVEAMGCCSRRPDSNAPHRGQRHRHAAVRCWRRQEADAVRRRAAGRERDVNHESVMSAPAADGVGSGRATGSCSPPSPSSCCVPAGVMIQSSGGACGARHPDSDSERAVGGCRPLQAGTATVTTGALVVVVPGFQRPKKRSRRSPSSCRVEDLVVAIDPYAQGSSSSSATPRRPR